MARPKNNRDNIMKKDIVALEETSIAAEIEGAEKIVAAENLKEEDEKIMANIEEAGPKNKVIIAKQPTPFRRSPNLSAVYISGMMPVGRSFEIVDEYSSKIYGDFYKLDNGMYITKGGLYSIS